MNTFMSLQATNVDSTEAMVKKADSPDQLIEHLKEPNKDFVCAPNTVSNDNYVHNELR